MDFGVVGLDSLMCSNSAAASNNGSFALEIASEANKHKGYGSGFLKQGRAINEADFIEFKVAKNPSSCGEKSLLQRTNSSNLSEGHQQQMLSFSSPNSQQGVGAATLPYYHHASSGFSRSTGIKSSSMQGVLSGVRGPFTPSQWMELEHQALIYKYINANVQIPTYLLNPIRKAFESVGFSTLSGLRSNALGWGAFHLGFSNSDPEPGRCRRTDGKKWRCSRDAVADQKYCERHMNRGRHRSRKPVEGQSGHAASSVATSNCGKTTSMASSTSAPVVAPGGGASNNLSLSHQQQLSKFQHTGADSRLPGLANVNRSVLDKETADGGYQQATFLSMASPKAGPKDHEYSLPNQQNASYQEFGLVCSDSLLNPLSSSYGISDNLNDQDNKSEHSLRQFMDDWPKSHPERMQLSISTPMATSDFMSSNEKLEASPLRLSEELEMGLGVGIISTEHSQRQANWVPISWEPSIGGPLGEVLHSTSNTTGDLNITKPLNLMDNRDNAAASPTGVLQKGAFGSLSNSSAGSSPRAESSKALDGSILCNGLMNPSLPAL